MLKILNNGYQLGCANRDLVLFQQSPGDFRVEIMDFKGSLGIGTLFVPIPRLSTLEDYCFNSKVYDFT